MGQQPVIKIGNYNPMPSEGTDIRITATITSTSTIKPGTAKWMIIGGDLPSGGYYCNYDINGLLKCVLSLHSLSISDSGNYIATATNVDGTSTASANIQVQKGSYCMIIHNACNHACVLIFSILCQSREGTRNNC